jgi:hypothetical protein
MAYPKWLRANYENYRFLLKKFSAYSDEKPVWSSSFSCKNAASDSALQHLKEKYALDKLAQNKNDLDACLKAMDWTFSHLLHKDFSEFNGNLHALEIVDFSRSNRVTVNCLCHATVLTEVLLAMGFKARAISCLPIDVIPNDNHVVTMVFIASLNKWVMLDPALCCYITDKNSVMLSIPEIRQSLIDDSPLEVHPYGRFLNAKSPGSGYVAFDKAEYFVYLYKNFFRFMSCAVQGANPDAEDPIFYHLIPDAYLAHNTEQKDSPEAKAMITRLTNNAEFFWYAESKEENNEI